MYEKTKATELERTTEGIHLFSAAKHENSPFPFLEAANSLRLVRLKVRWDVRHLNRRNRRWSGGGTHQWATSSFTSDGSSSMHASVDARARRAAGDGGAGRGCASLTGEAGAACWEPAGRRAGWGGVRRRRFVVVSIVFQTCLHGTARH